jgi:hypothetical protein
MKGSAHLLLIALLATGLSACSKKGSNHTTTKIQTIETLKTVEKETVKFISTFNYTLVDDNGCSTGTQVFSSIEDMCNGLQNNTLNNNCSLELREDFFKKNCTNEDFKPFDDESKLVTDNFSNVLEQKKMKNGDINIELIKVTPVGTAKNSVKSTFACASTLEDALRLENGFIFLVGSKAIINRDQSVTERKYPQAIFECTDSSLEQSSELLDETLVKKVSVGVGHAVMEYVVFEGERPEVLHSELSYISCSETKTEIMNSLTNGLNLVKGSRVIVRRDINTAQRSGIKDKQEFSLISCE